jgi:hypothetical protein
MATRDISELREIASNHAQKIETYDHLLSELEFFSKTVECPQLHKIGEIVIDNFSFDYFKKSKLLGKAGFVRRFRAQHDVSAWLQQSKDEICPKLLGKISTVMQELIRENKDELPESERYMLAAHKNIFFTAVKNKFRTSPPSQ